MARVTFTANLQRFVECPPLQANGRTVREVLDAAFAVHERARGYILDEHGALRHHVVVFVNGAQVSDRNTLGDPVGPDAELYVMQALSGG